MPRNLRQVVCASGEDAGAYVQNDDVGDVNLQGASMTDDNSDPQHGKSLRGHGRRPSARPTEKAVNQDGIPEFQRYRVSGGSGRPLILVGCRM